MKIAYVPVSKNDLQHGDTGLAKLAGKYDRVIVYVSNPTGDDDQEKASKVFEDAKETVRILKLKNVKVKMSKKPSPVASIMDEIARSHEAADSIVIVSDSLTKSDKKDYVEDWLKDHDADVQVKKWRSAIKESFDEIVKRLMD